MYVEIEIVPVKGAERTGYNKLSQSGPDDPQRLAQAVAKSFDHVLWCAEIALERMVGSPQYQWDLTYTKILRNVLILTDEVERLAGLPHEASGPNRTNQVSSIFWNGMFQGRKDLVVQFNEVRARLSRGIENFGPEDHIVFRDVGAATREFAGLPPREG